jgi:hypothetical protein
VGPAVVLNERDYGAAIDAECGRRAESSKLKAESRGQMKESEVGIGNGASGP